MVKAGGHPMVTGMNGMALPYCRTLAAADEPLHCSNPKGYGVGDHRAVGVHQHQVHPAESAEARRHLGDLLVRVRPAVLGVRRQVRHRPEIDIGGEIRRLETNGNRQKPRILFRY